MIPGVTFERLEAFLRVADAGSFAKAAKADPVRQSLMSRQVRALETALGGRALFERKPRGVALTEAGTRLRTLVRALRTDLDDVRRSDADEPVRFRFGAGDSVLHWWVIPRIAALAERVPRAVPTLVSLSSAEVVAQLEGAQLDFGLVRAADVPKGLEARPLGQLEYALYVPRRLRPPVAEGDDLGAALAALPLALQTSEPALNAQLLALARGRSPTSPTLECETFPQACRALRSGHYAALLPTVADIELPSREVVELKHPKLTRLAMKLHLAWHPRTARRSEAHAAIAAGLEEVLRLGKE